jgi:hypothetical protein
MQCDPAVVGFRAGSRQHLLHHLARHVGQAEVAALEAVGELGVVEAEEVPLAIDELMLVVKYSF